MTFYDEILRLRGRDPSDLMDKVTSSQVQKVLRKTGLSSPDFLALLSPAASAHLEEMAQLAHRLTVKHFGWTVQLYTPLYLANYCINHCVYCGFNAANPIPRRGLSLPEVDLEAKAIAATGLKHLLILTGESRRHSPVSYIKECVSILRKYFPSISIEIYPLEEEEYRDLVKAGVDGVTIYQEVYDQGVYGRLHPRGPKSDYRYRLETPERAAQAGIRTLNIGALLGLNRWRTEMFLTGLHAAYLQKRYPDIEVSVSFPRMRPHFGGYQPESPVSDAELVQGIMAIRLFLPRAGITISTREGAVLRDNLARLGVTKMSAGSSTVIGGHTDDIDGVGQFEISDKRSVAEMRTVLSNLGYRAVFKDWQDLNTGGARCDENEAIP